MGARRHIHRGGAPSVETASLFLGHRLFSLSLSRRPISLPTVYTLVEWRAGEHMDCPTRDIQKAGGVSRGGGTRMFRSIREKGGALIRSCLAKTHILRSDGLTS